MSPKILMVNLGPINQIPIGQGQCFIVNGLAIAVFRPRSGGLFAMENRCPHRGGPLAEGIVGMDKVICPLHGHKFGLTSGQGTEKHECVRTFKVREEAGEMILECPLIGISQLLHCEDHAPNGARDEAIPIEIASLLRSSQ